MLYSIMLHIRLICVGTLKEAYFRAGVAEYEKRLGKYCKIEIVEVRESDPKTETAEIARKITRGHVALFDVEGDLVHSVDLAHKIETLAQTTSTINFVIGGSNGVAPDFTPDERLSFGRITFPHQLFRVVALEQIYRAFTIINNEKYNK